MALFDEKTAAQLKEILDKMNENITLLFFTQEFECGACRDTRIFAEEISSFSKKIKLEVYDFQADKARAEELKIENIPALALFDGTGSDTGIRFYGLPGGYEINSFVEALLSVSGVRETPEPAVSEKLSQLKTEIHIKVMISLSCPYCTEAVKTANMLAVESPYIRSEMIDISVFPHLANKYNVTSVPTTIINEKHALIGVSSSLEILDSAGKS